MTRARDLADSADKDITGTLTVDSLTSSGNITVAGTVDGRDIATDGTKLDGIEALADVTDATNVTAAGAAMLTGATFTGAVTATSFSGDGSSLTGILEGAGYFSGNNGNTGDTTNGKGDIFRVHSQTLSSNVTIGATDNALAVGPLTLGSNVTLTVNGNLTVA